MRTLLLAFAVCVAACGCSTGLLKEDDAASMAVRTAMAAQVIDPAGVRDAAAVTGLDGKPARNAYERYEKSFSKSEAVPATDLGIAK